MILEASHPQFWYAFNDLGAGVGWHSAEHTQSAIHYYYQRSEEEGKQVNDRSFILLREDEPIIGFIGASVENNGIVNLLISEDYCISIENKAKLTTKVAKTFLKKFDHATEDVNGSIWYRDSLLDGELSTLSRYLLSKGAIASPLFFHVINLAVDEAALKSQVRKSYRSLINWGLRELNPRVLGTGELTWEQMLAFRQLHIREAGRETRSEESWRWQYEMVESDEAFVVLGELDNEVVSAGFFIYSQTNCFYGVSASRRDFFRKPMFHSLMWLAILHARTLGCSWFETGDQLYPNHPLAKLPSKKILGISEFKAGFGGETKIQLLLTLDRSTNN